MAAYGLQTGAENLRKEVVDKVIKQIAKPRYKFKQAVSITSSNAWKGTFFRESTDILAGKTGNATKEIPRGANFPQASPTWKEINSTIQKYGLEDTIFFEDIQTNDIDIQRRTMIKLTEGVVKAVDDEIWSVLTDGAAIIGGSVNDIQSISIANNNAWNGNSSAIIDDLLNAKQLIGEANYDTESLICFLSLKDHRSIVNYVAEKGAQFDALGTDAARNGRMAGLAGIKFVLSNSVAASYALVVKPKTVGTWRATLPLSSDVKVEAFKGTRIRICEMGVTELHDPLAAVLIDGTQGTGVEA